MMQERQGHLGMGSHQSATMRRRRPPIAEGCPDMTTPIHLIVSRIKRLSLPQQIFHLRALIRQEPLRSVRRNELQSLLTGKITKQLRRESKEQVA